MQTEIIEISHISSSNFWTLLPVTSEQSQYEELLAELTVYHLSCDSSYIHVTYAYHPFKLILDPIDYVAGRTGFGCGFASLFHLF